MNLPATHTDVNSDIVEKGLNQSLSGVIAGIEYCKPIGDGESWYSLIVEIGQEAKQSRVIGKFKEIIPGEMAKFSGRNHDFKGSGRLFEAVHAQLSQPRSPSRIISYLQSITQIDRREVVNFVSNLGDKPAALLDGPDQDIWNTVNNTTEDLVKLFIGEWKSRINNAYVLEVAEKLGMTMADLDKLRSTVPEGANIDEMIKRDPYLPFYKGVLPLSRCQKLALSQGIKHDDDQSIAALIYRTLIAKYNNTDLMSFPLDEILERVCRVINLTKRSKRYHDIVATIHEIINQYLSEVVCISRDRLALKKLLKLELDIHTKLQALSKLPARKLPDINEDVFSKVCMSRMTDDVAQLGFSSLTDLRSCNLNIIDSHSNNTQEPIIGLMIDVMHEIGSIKVISPNSQWVERIEAHTRHSEDVISRDDASEFYTREINLASYVILSHADQWNTSELASILELIDESTMLILIGDSNMPEARGQGSPYHQLFREEEYDDLILDLKEMYIPTRCKRSILIKKIENNEVIDLSSQPDVQQSLMIGSTPRNQLLQIANVYYSKIPDHLGINPHESVCFITDEEEFKLSKEINEDLKGQYFLQPPIYQGHHVITSNSLAGFKKNDSITVLGTEGEWLLCRKGHKDIKLPISVYDKLHCGPFKMISKPIYEPYDLVVIFLGVGGKSALNKTLILNALAMGNKVVLAGNLDAFIHSLQSSTKPVSTLKDQGFESSMLNNNLVNSSGASNKVYDDTDQIDFD